MILYFSGTGNSQYVAERIAEKTGDQIVSINTKLKQNNNDTLISQKHPLIFVCPTYAWRIPRVVDEFIRNTDFKGTNKVYFILTCGGETANAVQYVNKLCGYKDWELQGFAEIKMPDNYIAMFPSTDKATIKAMIEKAIPVINEIAENIYQGNNFQNYVSNGITGTLESGIVNSIFYKVFVNAKGFHVTETKCSSCGLCEKLCPLNNIKLIDGKPIWSKNCTHCMACINRCPKEAIEYKNNTIGKNRYKFDFQN